MRKSKKLSLISIASIFSVIMLTAAGYASDDKTIGYSPKSSMASGISPDQRMAQLEKAGIRPQSRMPMIADPAQLPAGLRKMLEKKAQDSKSSTAYGSKGLFPFTTKRALTSTKNNLATASYYKKDMARGVGKLWMRFGSDWYVCTGSIIDKGLVVTAAHCVHNFGEEDAGWADEVLFVPMQDGKVKPYGTWKGETWAIPTVYYNGTDSCEVAGVVCENDLAVVVIKKKPTNRYVGKAVFPSSGDSVGGKYNYQSGDYSYVDISALTGGETLSAAEITQFGYPVSLDDGTRMIRTDSLGVQNDPSNVVIGSDQTGGSSGGPWFVNYGRDYVSGGSDSPPAYQQMAVMAVTSWGYDDGGDMKIQGASRFGTNSIYTDISNIDRLHQDVCSAHPAHCY